MPESDTERSRPNLRWLILLGLATLGVGLRLTVLAPEPLLVKVTAAERGMVASTVTNSKAGTIRSRRRSKMSAETGGRVVAIHRREGDLVKTGELLMQLNDAPLVARLELSQAARVASEARKREVCLQRDKAERDLARIRELSKSNVASEEALDRLEVAFRSAKAGCNAARSEVKRVEAEVRAARAELVKAEIRAPFDGVIAEVNTEVGEWVTPSPPLLSSPAVIDILDPDALYISAPMDEVDSNRVRVGQSASITVDSHPDQSFAGEVVRVAPYVLDIEAQNRTIQVEVEFEDSESAVGMMVGTSADIEVTLESRHDTLRIPTAALLHGGRVLVLEDGYLNERALETGLRNWDYVEIKSGLEVGEQIVTSLDEKEVVAGAKAEIETEEAGTIQ